MEKIYIVGKVSGQENWQTKFLKAKRELFSLGRDGVEIEQAVKCLERI